MVSNKKVTLRCFTVFCILVIPAVFSCSGNEQRKTDGIPVARCGEAQIICDKLVRDIDFLREPTRGFIRAGYPRYFAPFGRDSLIISWQLIDYDPNIAKNTLQFLADRQGKVVGPLSEEPGKIIHWGSPDASVPSVYYSIDSTPLFIYVAGVYFEKTGDKAWLAKMWPHIENALIWCEEYGNYDHGFFLEYDGSRSGHLVNQGWKDGEWDHLHIAPPVKLVEVQGYYYAALMKAGVMARAVGRVEDEERYEARARALQKAFIARFWLPESRSFAFAIDGKGNRDRRITSNIGQLLFTGILDGMKDKQDAIVESMFAPDMWTSFGIRTNSMLNRDFDPDGYHTGSVWPHDNWIIARGLKRYGYGHEYRAVMSAQLLAFESFGNIPELYVVKDGKIGAYPEACVPQGWASGALLNFLLEKH